MDQRSILLVNHRLVNYAGSELVTLDLAREFLRRGWAVTVGCLESGAPLKAHFEALNVEWLDLASDFEAPDRQYDIMWGQHFTAFDRCLIDFQLEPERVVFASLSPFEPLEAPPLYAAELSAILANSAETAKKIESHGIPGEEIILFENPVADEVFDFPSRKRERLSKLAIVSNHVAPELKEAIPILQKSLEVEVYGLEHRHELITPALLDQYDVVVTIGRTVQQCLALGIPVYCYDIHGGPGYLSKAGFARTAEFNFSGRCNGKKKPPAKLVADILSGFNAALNKTPFFRDLAESRYRLGHAVDRVLSELDAKRDYRTRQKEIIFLMQRQRHAAYGAGKNYFAQVFFDLGHGYREADSVSHKIHMGRNRIEFALPEDAMPSAIRFDPANDSCVIDLHEVVAWGLVEASTHRLGVASSNADYHDESKLGFLNTDPQIELGYAHQGTGFETLRLDFTLLALGADAREMLLRQRLEVIEKRPSLADGLGQLEHRLVSEVSSLQASLDDRSQGLIQALTLIQEQIRAHNEAVEEKEERGLAHAAELAQTRETARAEIAIQLNRLAEREQASNAKILELQRESEAKRSELQREFHHQLEKLTQGYITQEQQLRAEISRRDDELSSLRSDASELQQAHASQVAQVRHEARQEIEMLLQKLAERERSQNTQIVKLQQEAEANRNAVRREWQDQLEFLMQQQATKEKQMREELEQTLIEFRDFREKAGLEKLAIKSVLDSVYSTRSWRWTSPVRRFYARFFGQKDVD